MSPAKTGPATASRTRKSPAKTTAKSTRTPSAKSATPKPTPKPASKTTASRAKTSGGTLSAPAAAPAAPEPKVVGQGPDRLRKKELIAAVVEKSGVKKKFAKPVVETLLAEMGQALADGRELDLQPFGKVKINRTKDLDEGRSLVVKMRQNREVPAHDAPRPDAAPAAKAPLAEVPEEL